MSPRRIGLFGGSFDPVHRAHLALARAALQQLALDEVRFVPAGRPWQKPDRLQPGVHRAAMLRLAVADPREGDPRFVVDECELRRDGPTYTIDTVEALQRRLPGVHWVLLLGQDQHERLHTWHRWRELLARVELGVAARPADPHAPLPAAPADPEVLARGHRMITMPPMGVSSTELRRRLQAGTPLDELVPPAVAGYIACHRLYRDAPASGRQPPLRS